MKKNDIDRFHALVEALPAVVYEMDLQGRLTYVNEAAKTMFGFTDEDLAAGLYIGDRLVPEDRERARKNIERIVRGEPLGPNAYTVTTKAGRRIPVLIHSNPIVEDGETVGLRGLLLDVSEQKAIEDELQRNQTRLRRILDSIPDMMFRVDEQGRLLDYFCRDEQRLYAPPQEFLNRRLTEVLPEDVATLAMAAIGRALKTGDAEKFEYRLDTGDGPRDFEGRALRIHPDELFFIIRDITEEKRLNARLLASDRLAAVGTLAAGIAHEINNPLSYVAANLGYVARKIDKILPQLSSIDIEDLGSVISDAREGVDRIRRIVADLRRFTRSDDAPVSVVDICEVMDSALAMADNELRHRARVEKEYEGPAKVRGSDHRIAQVFLNLLVNAAQAIPDGDARRNVVRVSIRSSKTGSVRIEVSDTGPGIPRELLPRIFEPFLTTKAVGHGTGLGLSICRGIIEDMGGTIAAESPEGGGARFIVELPSTSGPVCEASSTAADDAVSMSRNARILVVDDEPPVLRALTRLLRDHEVICCATGESAVKMLEVDEGFDLILCDLMMPDLGGADFYARVEQIRPKLVPRIVYMTGGAFSDAARRFLERVSNDRLEKPFDSELLAKVVQSHLGIGG